MGLKYREPTHVSVVLEYLRKRMNEFVFIDTLVNDLFVTVSSDLPGDASPAYRRRKVLARISSSLWMLHQYKCVDFAEGDAGFYWFALPEHMDTRSKVAKGRVREVKPRRTHKRKNKSGNDGQKA